MKRIPWLIAILLLLTGCETMQPIVETTAALGVSSGAITQSQAESFTRSAVAVGKTFEDITPEQEYYIGRAVAATVLKRYPPYPRDEANHYINVVGQTLARASDRPETFGGYHFLILDSADIQAFAAPGGLILVSRGMVRCCPNEDALAAVLAHEIGHVQARDGLRAIKTSRITSAFTILAAEGAKNFGGEQIAQLTQAFEGSVSDITQTLLNSGYSRHLERQADEASINIMRRVGYNPQGLLDLLGVMKTRLKPGGLDFAKTHPDAEARASDVRALIGGSTGSAPPRERQVRLERSLAGV
jgi:predicted Zn-dependent protease